VKPVFEKHNLIFQSYLAGSSYSKKYSSETVRNKESKHKTCKNLDTIEESVSTPYSENHHQSNPPLKSSTEQEATKSVLTEKKTDESDRTKIVNTSCSTNTIKSSYDNNSKHRLKMHLCRDSSINNDSSKAASYIHNVDSSKRRLEKK